MDREKIYKTIGFLFLLASIFTGSWCVCHKRVDPLPVPPTAVEDGGLSAALHGAVAELLKPPPIARYAVPRPDDQVIRVKKVRIAGPATENDLRKKGRRR